MSRAIPSDLLTALTSNSIEPFFALEFIFDSRVDVGEEEGDEVDVGPLRLWTGLGDRDIVVRGTSQTFIGTGSLLSIGNLEEVNDLSAKNLEITLSGVDPSILSLALQEPYQRRPFRLYFGEQGVSDVVEVFAGSMDQMSLVDEPDSSTIKMSVESNLVRLEESSGWRYTDENYQSRYAGDTFFSYVQSIQDVQVPWGRKSA